MAKKKKRHTTCIKSHTAHWFFMSREVGHDPITVRILTHKHLYKKKANGSYSPITHQLLSLNIYPAIPQCP